jgi:hypothetical protein
MKLQPLHIFGIDFSGAKDAGKKIWVAGGRIEGTVLQIEECWEASDLPGAGNERDICLAALHGFIANETDSAFGLDFPFGLPLVMVAENSWEDFVMRFPERYGSPGEFRDKCRRIAHDLELKRVTDRESKTPFSPYNLRVYRQTYYGIREILFPLVHGQKACVLPMQLPQPGKPWIIEICPASTLKKKDIYKSYKGKEHREQRLFILEALENTGSITICRRSIRENIMDDDGGDALDSVIAAYSTFCSWRNHFAVEINEHYGIEGYVFA